MVKRQTFQILATSESKALNSESWGFILFYILFLTLEYIVILLYIFVQWAPYIFIEPLCHEQDVTQGEYSSWV